MALKLFVPIMAVLLAVNGAPTNFQIPGIAWLNGIDRNIIASNSPLSANLQSNAQSMNTWNGITSMGQHKGGAGSFGPSGSNLGADANGQSNTYNVNGDVGTQTGGSAVSTWSGSGNPLGIADHESISRTAADGLFLSDAASRVKGAGTGSDGRIAIDTLTNTFRNGHGNGAISSGTGQSALTNGGGSIVGSGGVESKRITPGGGLIGSKADASAGIGGSSHNGGRVNYNSQVYSGDHFTASQSSSSVRVNG